MRSLFVCPLCSSPLQREERRYVCPHGHSFDLAREGYTYLLPVNRKHSRAPGDDADMSAARLFCPKAITSPCAGRCASWRYP